MMRNESPILEAFLDQAAEFFDALYLVDHSSSDNSVEIATHRKMDGLQLFNLISAGYPQSEIATFFARRVFENPGADYLFFLDCDEFLPFTNRSELEDFLVANSSYDVIELPWLNICPESLNGGNIFGQPFTQAAHPSPILKVVLSRRAFDKSEQLKVYQGYHGVEAKGCDLATTRPAKTYLLHIPIRSRVQIAFKLVSGHNRIGSQASLIKKKEGTHWQDLANEFRFCNKPDEFLIGMALNYPNIRDNTKGIPLKFLFPYIKSEYCEDAHFIEKSTVALLSSKNSVLESESSFTLLDCQGEIILSNNSVEKFTQMNIVSSSQIIPPYDEQDVFSTLFEPLFNLPTKMPPTAWSGHIPFLFVLFKLLRPRCYVELGVHNGASFITACTAAKQYQLETQLFGIDCWFGDEHAGFYDGDATYNDLLNYTERTFRNARLIRSYFHEARPSFTAGSVDLLHIDGLHTYDAVKEDYTTWVTAMAPSGVVLFHDTNVHDRGFGVHRLWNELSADYFTLEFFHSYGLGVLFLNAEDPRISLLAELKKQVHQWPFYRNLVALIAESLPERVGWIENSRRVAELQGQLDASKMQAAGLLNSTSWKITRPLRSVVSRLR
ncbi:class I SAM-dependent methyltransferase [Phyllobacterium bourgognense]|nr:class I SAM-dependent methyltransferase [Phyllobacterium bourgognense]